MDIQKKIEILEAIRDKKIQQYEICLKLNPSEENQSEIPFPEFNKCLTNPVIIGMVIGDLKSQQ